MKLVLLASVAFLATPALSQNDDANPMVITAPSRPTVALWSQKITTQINRYLASPRAFGKYDSTEGTVSVRFSCAEDGKPVSVVLFRSSGDRVIDGAAMRAIAHLDTLHPMPATIRHDITVQANIIFAVDESSLARQSKVLRRNEARRIANDTDRDRAVVVLEISRRAAG